MKAFYYQSSMNANALVQIQNVRESNDKQWHNIGEFEKRKTLMA